MSDHTTAHRLPPVESTRILLNEHATELRARLINMRQNMAQVRGDISESRAAQLLETTEHLMQTALHAQAIAETAVSDLAELAHTSQHDPVTGLPNRALVLDRIESAIAIARRHETRIGVLFLDLDGFKLINDELGHAVGDQALQLVARRLESIVRDSDTVSRYGGDEFVVLLTEISQPADAAVIAEKIGAALSSPCSVGEHALHLSASIGVSIYPEDGEDGAALIRRADTAMYRSKRRSKGGFEFHHAQTPANHRGALDVVETAHDTTIRSQLPVTVDAPSLCELRAANEKVVVATQSVHELEMEAERAHHRQIKFLAMVAHELRNPHSPFRTAAELLQHAPTQESQFAELRVIVERQLARMAQLIDDLLDESRATTGKFRLEPTTVRLDAILAQSVQTCRHAMDTKLQHLHVKLPLTPVTLYGDAARLTQIFSNLLENSCKFTPLGGKITLAVEVLDDVIEISVSDNGMGISAEVLPKIFQLFVRGKRAFVFHESGLGIGLAVVRELVEAHGGTVVGHSLGKDLGSEFVVTLQKTSGPEDGARVN